MMSGTAANKGVKVEVVAWMNKALGAVFQSRAIEDDESGPVTPLLLTKKKAGNSRRLLIGHNKFKAGDLHVNGNGLSIVGSKAYQNKYGSGDTERDSKKIAVYHPLKQDLRTVDTTVELSMQKNGEWVAQRNGERISTLAGQNDWLNGNAFDELDITDKQKSRPGRYLKIGSREFCYADVSGWHKDATKTDRLVVERICGKGASGGHFRVLNADLSPGAEVKLAAGAGTVLRDPFTDQAVREVQLKFSDRTLQACQPFATAGVEGAMSVGIGLDAAVKVAEHLTDRLATDPGFRADPAAATAAGAVAATAHSAGIAPDRAWETGREVARLRRSRAPNNPLDPIGQARVQQVQQVDQLARTSYQAAETNYRTLDRSTSGPSVSAIDEVSQFLFEQSKPGDTGLDAKALVRAAAQAKKTIEHAEEMARRYEAEARAAGEEYSRAVERRNETAADLEQTLRRHVEELAPIESEIAARAPDVSRALMDESERLKAKIRELGLLQDQSEQGVDQLRAISEQKMAKAREARMAVGAIRQPDAAEINAIVGAMVASRAAAPGNPTAARAAAHAALNAVRANCDAATVTLSAATAQLSVMAGAKQDKAEIAGLAAVHYSTARAQPGPPPDDSELAIAQAAIAGAAQGSTADAFTQLQLAAAAAATLGGAAPNIGAAASILKMKPDALQAPQPGAAVGTAFIVATRDSLADVERKTLTAPSKNIEPTIPKGFRPLSVSPSDAAGRPVPGQDHTKERVVTERRQTDDHTKREYEIHYIEVIDADGIKRWVEFFPDAKGDDIKGEIVVTSSQSDAALGAQSVIKVGFNGYRKEWGLLSTREQDRKAILEAIKLEFDKLSVLRDSDWGAWNTPYHFDENPEAKTAISYLKDELGALVSQYIRGRISGTTYETRISALKTRVLNRLQQERTRKKQQNRTKITMGMTIVLGVLTTAVNLTRAFHAPGA